MKRIFKKTIIERNSGLQRNQTNNCPALHLYYSTQDSQSAELQSMPLQYWSL